MYSYQFISLRVLPRYSTLHLGVLAITQFFRIDSEEGREPERIMLIQEEEVEFGNKLKQYPSF